MEAYAQENNALAEEGVMKLAQTLNTVSIGNDSILCNITIGIIEEWKFPWKMNRESSKKENVWSHGKGKTEKKIETKTKLYTQWPAKRLDSCLAAGELNHKLKKTEIFG